MKNSISKNIIFCKFQSFFIKNNVFAFIIFDRIFFLIASSQIFKNDAILINHGSFFQGEDSLQLDYFQFLEMNQLFSNSAILLIKMLFWKIVF